MLFAVTLPATAYIATKLVSVIKFVFSFGTIRAAVALAVAGIVDATYQFYLQMPMFAEMVKSVKSN